MPPVTATKSRLHNGLIKTDKTDLRHDFAVCSYGSPSLHQTIKEVGEQVRWGVGAVDGWNRIGCLVLCKYSFVII